MARLKDVFEDLLAKIAGSTTITYTRVWNNQVELQQEGGIYSFPSPAAFVEIASEKEQLGLGFVGGDITVKVHIVHVQYDAGDGTFEQNYDVYALRDQVIQALTYYEPVGCSGMMLIDEQPDYNHNNVYHYTVSFICSFIDATGDQTTTQIIKDPPTDLEVNGTIVNSI